MLQNRGSGPGRWTASFAFILGVVPLRVTLFGIFLTPVFFHVIRRVGERRRLAALAEPVEVRPLPEGDPHRQAIRRARD